MRLISTLISLAFLAILATFVTHNTTVTELNFWPFDIKLSMPTSLMALIFFALGCMFGSVLTIPRLWHASRDKRKITKEVKKLEKEIKKLKTPKTDPDAGFFTKLIQKPKGNDNDQ